MSNLPIAGSFCWFECASTNPDAAREFYASLFDWKVTQVAMAGDMGGHYTIFRIGGGDIAGLFPMTGPMFERAQSHWSTYVASDDVDASTETARKLGATVIAEPMDVEGVGRVAVLQDPTGALISLFCAGEHCGSAHFGTMVPNSFCWSELATRDPKAAETFYTELFPWRVKPSQSPGPAYTEFLLGDVPIGGMMEMTPQHGEALPHWLPYVLVEDCDGTAARAGELGAQPIVPPQDIPDTGRFSVFLDPAGAALAVFKLERGAESERV